MLEADDLTAFRGERLVLAGVSLRVAAGGALLLTGPNGAGKSTLLRVLAGFVRPETGRVRWQGEDMRGAYSQRVCYVGHLDALKLGLTAAENLRAWGSRAAVATALGRLDLAHVAALPARMLSAGQRRRLALARLLLSPAPVWLLDEPTLALDATSVERFGLLLADHRAGGGVVIAATHVPLPLHDADTLAMGDATG